jgi:hypothetical protein
LLDFSFKISLAIFQITVASIIVVILLCSWAAGPGVFHGHLSTPNLVLI